MAGRKPVAQPHVTQAHTPDRHGLRPVEEGPGDETHHTFRMLLLVYDVSENAGSEPIRGCLVAAHALVVAGTRDSDLLAKAEGVAVTDEELRLSSNRCGWVEVDGRDRE